jgi:hypothetical protein
MNNLRGVLLKLPPQILPCDYAVTRTLVRSHWQIAADLDGRETFYSLHRTASLLQIQDIVPRKDAGVLVSANFQGDCLLQARVHQITNGRPSQAVHHQPFDYCRRASLRTPKRQRRTKERSLTAAFPLIHRLPFTYHLRYIASVGYEIERTDEFTDWWNGLTEGEQIAVAKVVGVLEEKGPDLKRPYVGKIEGSKRIPNLKELIVQYGGDPYRVFFCI